MKAIIILSATGVLALLSEVFNFKRILMPLVMIGLMATIGVLALDWNNTVELYGMMQFDHYAIAFTSLMTASTLLWYLMSNYYIEQSLHKTDLNSLIIFSLTGAMIMTSFTNLTMLFLGIEILSIPMYVLAGSKKNDLNSNEAGLKYFLMGAFATGILLFGVALIYGATGSFRLAAITEFINEHHDNLPSFFYTGLLFVIAGLAFKVSAAPFHFWAPDVYQGSPNVITAFMASVVKTAGLAAFLRLFTICFGGVIEFWSTPLWVIIGLTFIISNLTAAVQQHVKRMMAFSSISHAGFMLLAILAMSGLSKSALLYYAAAYSAATIIAFTVLINVNKANGNDTIASFNGLSKRNPLLAFAMTIALLSMAGIPPLAGFFAKYYVLMAAIQSKFIGLSIIAILTSLVGVYYYFKVIIAMYFKSPENDSVIETASLHQMLLIICIAIIIAIGLLPDAIIGIL